MGLIKQREQRSIGPAEASLLRDDLSRREMSLAKASKAAQQSQVCHKVESSCSTCSGRSEV